jgi:ATP-dependent DNA helicase RecG
MKLSDDELGVLFDAGESWQVEKKESLSGSAPKAILEAVCAFANDLPGSGKAGVIFVGVKDKGGQSDFRPDDKNLLTLTNMKTDGRIVPPPTMLVEKRGVRDLELAVVTVLPSDSPPVRVEGAIHVRIGPRKGIATAQDERILNEKRRAQTLPFDIQPLPGVGLDALSLRLFEEEYLPRAFNIEVLAENGRTAPERLAALKMIARADDPTVTVLGCLVLGKSPRDIIPCAFIQFLRIAGSDLTDPIVDEQVIDGTLSDVLRRIDEKLAAHTTTGVDLTSSERERRSATYPLAALQQIVRNAVMHRTYEATNAPIRVYWYDDRIEVHSPGGPFGQVTPENFGMPGITDYRNPNLAEAMKVLGYVQRFGVGIATARRLLKEAGHPEPEFTVNANHVLALVRGKAA